MYHKIKAVSDVHTNRETANRKSQFEVFRSFIDEIIKDLH